MDGYSDGNEIVPVEGWRQGSDERVAKKENEIVLLRVEEG